MKKILIIGLYLFSILFVSSAPSIAGTPMALFDITVSSSVTDTYDYEYTLNYGRFGSAKAISHWWLEINCAHSSIDKDSLYGYTYIGSTRYDWDFEFDIIGNKSVKGYDDWVIKWDAEQTNPDGSITKIEPPKVGGGLIGTFGFHSTQPPIDGNWGSKGGRIFETGVTQIPQCVPEPTSLILFGIGAFGYSILKRKNLKKRGFLS